MLTAVTSILATESLSELAEDKNQYQYGIGDRWVLMLGIVNHNIDIIL